MISKLGRLVGVVAAGTTLTLGAGLVACTPAPAAISCSAVPSPAHPVQYSNETVTLKTSPGASLLAVANYKTMSRAAVSKANANGVARLVYPVGKAQAGYPVKVSFIVSKGTDKAGCSTVFTPARSVGVSAPLGVPAVPQVTVTAAPTGEISLVWSDSSADATGYKVLLQSPTKTLVDKTFPAGSNGTSAAFGSALANVCNFGRVPDSFTGRVVATNSAGDSAAYSISGHMPRSAPPAPSAPGATGGYQSATLAPAASDCPVTQVRITHTTWSGGPNGGNPVTTVETLSADHVVRDLKAGEVSCAYYCFFNYEYTFQLSQCSADLSQCSAFGPASSPAVIVRDVPPPSAPVVTGLVCHGTDLQWTSGFPNQQPSDEAPVFYDYIADSGAPQWEKTTYPYVDVATASGAGVHTLTVWAEGRDGQTSGRTTISASCP